jgi:hypothetical protein
MAANRFCNRFPRRLAEAVWFGVDGVGGSNDTGVNRQKKLRLRERLDRVDSCCFTVFDLTGNHERWSS